jgi:hypothetical protein
MKKSGKAISFSKSDLVFYFNFTKFPTDLIDQEVSKMGDLIFSLESLGPENYQITKKKIKLSNCFIIEDEIEPKKGFAKKGKINAPIKNRIDNNQLWRRTEPDDPGFFDDFKGKSDETKVITFKRNLELFEKTELSISIENCVLYDHIDMKDKEFFDIKKNGNKEKNGKINKVNPVDNTKNTALQHKEIVATADDLFSEDGLFSNLGGGQNKQSIFILLKYINLNR